MSKQWITVKEVAFNNNCPECFSKNHLELTFKQEYIETKLSRSVTQNISTDFHCNNCKTVIYPERWTEDIERVYEYRLKAFKPKKSSKKFKPLFFILIGIVFAVLIALIAIAVTL